MLATIDFGNTRGKLALFEAGRLVDFAPLEGDAEAVAAKLAGAGATAVMVGKVGPGNEALMARLRQGFEVHELTHRTPLPIGNAYGTPETLGMDRLAAAAGAWALFPGQASLVIDLGTCMTCDFIDRQGVYQGGSISPGMRMRARAMQAFTAALPLVESYEGAGLVGRSTQESLRSGAVLGLAYEIEGRREACREGFGIFNTVLCGGDAQFFESMLKAPIFVRTALVPIGLHAILEHLLRPNG
jgi:type III pantothenate kinase